jgi:hypothetical protein
LSDSHGNAAGTEFGEWLGKEQYDSFGYISAFDLKAWAEAHYLHFTPGQFYRVKLGIGPYRRETTQLLFISPPSAQLQINNSIGPLINVPGPLYLMSLNGVSGCAEKYILRMENSDASGSHNGGGFLEILSRHDYDRYGSIGHFNLAKWARERGIPLTAGKYYRVSLETVPTATSEAAVLVHLQ